MLILFAVTLFVSAFLLFWVQPMFGKMILPLLGGSPSVWNTCMVFFQASLLVGYLYAHLSTTLLSIKRQALLHIFIILLPFIILPIHISANWKPPVIENPIPALLLLMLISVGLPFFVISTTAPILQKWFSSTSHRAAKDPYFLYVASNFGSMFALIGYPVLIEPNLRVVEQSRIWFYLYFLFVLLIAACASILWRSLIKTEKKIVSEAKDTKEKSFTLNSSQRIRWVLLSLIPSSLMLGVTTYFSIDISPVPLFWVIPLAIYLLTFILVFAKKTILPHSLMVKLMPYVVLTTLVYMLSVGTQVIWVVFLLHLLTFFVCSMVCHGELATTRPPTKYLTEFYLLISLGGFLGGLFNALVAPLIFKEVIEYPLAIVLACLLKPSTGPFTKKEHKLLNDLIFGFVIGVTAVIIKIWLQDVRTFHFNWIPNAIIYGIPAIICLRYSYNSIRFGLGVAAIVIVFMFYINVGYKVLFTERNFFGVHRITVEGNTLKLYQDTTLHGYQRIDQLDDCVPLSYYHHLGPIGQLFDTFADKNKKIRVAAVGLGAGSLACYGKKKQRWVFYEIDPTIVLINNNAEYFTYLVNSPPDVYVVFGDGRLSLQKAPDKYYDLIILDAFSSDAIPIHLITREALKLYQQKLAKGGIIAFHISNKYLNLAPVLGNLAWDSGMVAVIQYDYNRDPWSGKEASEWVLLAERKDDLGKIAYDSRWQQLTGRPDLDVWTDDYSNIFSILNWGKF